MKTMLATKHCDNSKTYTVIFKGENIGQVKAPSRVSAEIFLRHELELTVGEFKELVILVEEA